MRSHRFLCEFELPQIFGQEFGSFDRPISQLFRTLASSVASWLARWTREARVRILAGVIVLCSWARHFTLTVPLSTQEYHEWVPANC